MKSGINPEVLERLAWETGYPYPTILRDVVKGSMGQDLEWQTATEFKAQVQMHQVPMNLGIESQIAYAR